MRAPAFTIMSRNLKLFLGATILFYIIGAENDATGMYVLSAACLAVILACYFLTRLLVRGTEVEVDFAVTRSRVSREVPARLRVRNAGRIARAGMSLAVEVVNETVPQATRGYEFTLPLLPARSRSDLEVSFTCEARGRHRLSGTRLIASDPLGLYHRPKVFPGEASFLVLPRVSDLEHLATWELLSPEGRRLLPLLERMGSDFQGIREHVPGDDLRHVHWKASAHLGELAIKEYQRHREAEVAVWLDLWTGNHPPGGPRSPTETAISLVATLLTLFMRRGHVVSLAGQGLPGALSLPSRGEAYLDHALVALAEARPRDGLCFGDLCREGWALSPRLVNCFAVTTAAEEGLVEAFGTLTRRGASSVVFLVGSGEGLAPGAPERLSARALDAMAGRLLASGVRAARVRDFTDIPRALAQVAGDAMTARVA